MKKSRSVCSVRKLTPTKVPLATRLQTHHKILLVVDSIQVIKQKHDLDADWLNYLAQMLMYDEVIVPDGKLWKRFGPLHVYAPASEYILALKITAGRQKDLDDCAILLPKTTIRSRKQAQQYRIGTSYQVGNRRMRDAYRKRSEPTFWERSLTMKFETLRLMAQDYADRHKEPPHLLQ